jgi:hypothetical protein
MRRELLVMFIEFVLLNCELIDGITLAHIVSWRLGRVIECDLDHIVLSYVLDGKQRCSCC